MFEKSRNGSWFYSLHSIILKMVERIAVLRTEQKGKSGVMEKVVGKVRNRWENCVGFRVHELEGNESLFVVYRKGKKASEEEESSYNIDVMKKFCDCGEWQEHGVPCIDAVAYCRLHKHLSLEEILNREVDHHYTYANETKLLRKNIVPVCIDRISHDGTTLPPKMSSKRSTGRPKKKRIRKRSHWAFNPEKSNIVCSRCRQRGHNIRTCLAREEQARQGMGSAFDLTNVQDMDLS